MSQGRLLSLIVLILALTAGAAAQQGWYPHEGGLLKYRVDIRFGEDSHTMPKGWTFGRVSAVATDSRGQVFVSSESDLRVALDLGVADIIRKPFSGTLLLHRVGRLLEDR